MSELTLEALGYRRDEAATARRTHDLTHTKEQRAAALREILACARQERARAIPHEQEMPA
jgi:hypothetical protein